jgi:hypothetical protein
MAYTGIKTRNKTEEQAIEVMTRCFNFLQKKLNTKAKLEFGRTAIWGKDAFHSGLYTHGKKEVILNFRNLYGFDFDTLLQVLSHEMRHAYQDHKGWFDNPNRERYFMGFSDRSMGGRQSGYWKGEYVGRTEYKDLPWEIDARSHERTYRDMCVQAGIISDKELATHLPGNKTRKSLVNETIREFNKKNPGVMILTAYAETQQEHKARCVQARKEANDKMSKLGFKLVENTWTYKGPKSQSAENHRKARKVTINPSPRRKERQDGFCWFKGNRKQLRSNNNFEKSQKNFVAYKTRLLTIQDLTC